MKILRLLSILSVLLVFFAVLAFSIRPAPDIQFATMLALLFVVVLLVISFIGGMRVIRRDTGIRAFVPAIICFTGLPLSFFLGSWIGTSIRVLQFERDLPRFAEVVHLIETGEISRNASGSGIELPRQYRDLSALILLQTNRQNLAVEFLRGGGFPTKHSGYLYVSTGNIEDYPEMLKRWPSHSRIVTNWFRISD